MSKLAMFNNLPMGPMVMGRPPPRKDPAEEQTAPQAVPQQLAAQQPPPQQQSPPQQQPPPQQQQPPLQQQPVAARPPGGGGGGGGGGAGFPVPPPKKAPPRDQNPAPHDPAEKAGAMIPPKKFPPAGGKSFDKCAKSLFDLEESPAPECCAFKKGDLCQIIKDNGEWLHVKFLEDNAGTKPREGFVPSNYFDPCPVPRRAKASFDFEAPKPQGFVALKKDDIMIVESGGAGDEWWVVKRGGQTGYVPSNRVVEISLSGQ